MVEPAESWRRKYEEDERQWREYISNLGDRLFPRLAELGIAKITVEVMGGGDSGSVNSIDVEMEAGREAPALDQTEFEGKSVRVAIEDLVMAELTKEYPGWEMDWGSDSTYVVKVRKRKVKCTHFQECARVNEDDDEDDDEEEAEEGED